MADVLKGDIDWGGRSWYVSREEMEHKSPSRRDGIDLKKENELRQSYTNFVQKLGIKLKLSQLTIATSMVLCHRFFLRQSHAANDWRTIATACVFLAAKVEDTPRPLNDVVSVSCQIVPEPPPHHQRQKEWVLVAENVVLRTLGFDTEVQHSYRHVVEAVNKLELEGDRRRLTQVTWNFVNDGVRTCLCLQYKAAHVAAGALYLASKLVRVKLPVLWWKEFDVTPRQLEQVTIQMLKIYEQIQQL